MISGYENIQSLEAPGFLRPQQLAAQFILNDLRHDHACTARQMTGQPLLAGVCLDGAALLGDQREWT